MGRGKNTSAASKSAGSGKGQAATGGGQPFTINKAFLKSLDTTTAATGKQTIGATKKQKEKLKKALEEQEKQESAVPKSGTKAKSKADPKEADRKDPLNEQAAALVAQKALDRALEEREAENRAVATTLAQTALKNALERDAQNRAVATDMASSALQNALDQVSSQAASKVVVSGPEHDDPRLSQLCHLTAKLTEISWTDVLGIVEVFETLSNIPVDMELLKRSRIVLVTRRFKEHSCKTVRVMVRKLRTLWKLSPDQDPDKENDPRLSQVCSLASQLTKIADTTWEDELRIMDVMEELSQIPVDEELLKRSQIVVATRAYKEHPSINVRFMRQKLKKLWKLSTDPVCVCKDRSESDLDGSQNSSSSAEARLAKLIELGKKLTETAWEDDQGLISVIEVLSDIPVDMDLLTRSQIGIITRSYKEHPSRAIRSMVHKLRKLWKLICESEEDSDH